MTMRLAAAARAAAVAASLALGGGSGSALATGQPLPPPSANHVFGGCVLSQATHAGLVRDVARKAPAAFDPKKVRVSFVVVYTLANPNDGQPLKGGAGTFTGPVLCAAPSLPGIGVGVEKIDEQADIANIDIRAAEEALILQYKPAGAADGRTEKRFCHTAANNTDCFRIFPKP